MKIIALKGANSVGKSSTLNLVCDNLIKTGSTIHTSKIVRGNPSKNDFECILNYMGKSIAIYTMGDFGYLTIAAIKNYESLSIDVLIIATNNRLVKPTKEILKYTNVIISKTVASPKTPSNNLKANKDDCNLIISHI